MLMLNVDAIGKDRNEILILVQRARHLFSHGVLARNEPGLSFIVSGVPGQDFSASVLLPDKAMGDLTLTLEAKGVSLDRVKEILDDAISSLRRGATLSVGGGFTMTIELNKG